MKFKYSQYPTPEGKFIYRPSIPIIFKNDHKFIHMEALIDSGADFTILPIEIAGVLGAKLHTKESFEGAGGNPFPVHSSPTKIEFILRQSGFREIKWKTTVYFAESQPIILLGNNGFLNQVKVIIDGRNREVEILK